MNHSNTAFKPNLSRYGKYKVNKLLSLKKVVAVVAALPLGTSWMFLILPFVKGSIRMRF